jgi:hypothetical protein
MLLICPKLVRALLSRLDDLESESTEIDEVRSMCVISIGRMNAVSVVDKLREYSTDGSHVSQSCY